MQAEARVDAAAAALQRSESNLAQVQINHELDGANFERAKQLHPAKAISKEEFDMAKTQQIDQQAAGKKGSKKRANGIVAREKILDAAAEIATERGYEGTSISLVSKRSGFPASSIYWHFDDKDDLIAAVIERSFGAWLQALSDQGSPDIDRPIEEIVFQQSANYTESIKSSPEFLRLGLMLGLEQRPEDPTARKMFLKVRSQAFRKAVKNYGAWLPDSLMHGS